MVSSFSKIQALIGDEFPKAVIPLIEQSKKEILIVVYDWRFYENDIAGPVQIFNQAIINSKKRGVNVQAIIENKGMIDRLKNVGINAKGLSYKKLIHSKFMIIDHKFLILGSHNYTRSAFCFNLETSLLIENDQLIKRFTDFFYNLYGR